MTDVQFSIFNYQLLKPENAPAVSGAKSMETKEIIVNGFDLIALNREYAELLRKHENDTDVQGESREHFLSFGDAKDETDMIKYHASICNAWDELCSKHEGLRDSGLSWYAGAQWTDYPTNLWDIYIGTGDELD